MPISSLLSFARRDNGATAPEYALLIALIAAVIAAAVGTIGNKLVQIFTNAAGWF
jgi:Flp pilus assembly pilin Flp